MLTTSIPIGKLDRKITIQEPVKQNNDHNEDAIIDWDDLVGVWAHAEQRQGSEVVDADRVTYYETTIFTIRYRADLNVMMRILFQGVPYRIFSITEHKGSRKGYMEIAAEIMDTALTTSTGGGDEEGIFDETFDSTFS